MRKLIPLILVFCLLLCGCESYSVRQGVEFPLPYQELVCVEAFCHSTSEKKTVTDEESLQSLYATFRYMELRSGPIPEFKEADIYSFRFVFSNHSSYTVIYEAVDAKEGILTAENLNPHLTNTDLRSFWENTAAEAVSVPADEVPSLTEEALSAEEIRQLLLNFFDTKQQDFLSLEDDSISHFFTPLTRQNLDILDFSRAFRIEKVVRQDLVNFISDEDFQVTLSNISVSGDTASAVAQEIYTYCLEENNGGESVRSTSYTFSLIRLDGEWKINFIEISSDLTDGLIEGFGEVDAYFN